jgi:hypothetical protein
VVTNQVGMVAVPSPPRSPRWKVAEDTAVEVSWQPPMHPNGVILHYILLYSKDRHENLQHWSTKVVNGEWGSLCIRLLVNL